MTLAYKPTISKYLEYSDMDTRDVSPPTAGGDPLFKQTNSKLAFIASPMSGFSDDSLYKKNREMILSLVNHLKVEHGFDGVYFAGQDLVSNTQFNSSPVALEKDMSALRQSDIFIFVYPSKVLSSVLIEAGYAMALNKPMLLLVKDRKDLPYLLQEAEKLGGEGIFPHIEIKLYEDEDSLKRSVDVSIHHLLNSVSL